MSSPRVSAIGQCLAGLDQRIVDADDTYLELVGRNRHEVIGAESLSFTYAADRVRNRPLLVGLSEGAAPFAITKRYVRPSGELVWVRNHVNAFRDGATSPLLCATCELLSSSEGADALVENLEAARVIRDALRKGRETFGRDIVSAPPMEALLLMYIAELEGSATTLEGLSDGLGVSSHVVRRWVSHLHERGLSDAILDHGSDAQSTVRIGRNGELMLEELFARGAQPRTR